MPRSPSQSLILMDRPMSDGTRYNTLMNGRSILARSNAKSIFNYPSPSAFSLSINSMYGVYAGIAWKYHENNERTVIVDIKYHPQYPP